MFNNIVGSAPIFFYIIKLYNTNGAVIGLRYIVQRISGTSIAYGLMVKKMLSKLAEQWHSFIMFTTHWICALWDVGWHGCSLYFVVFKCFPRGGGRVQTKNVKIVEFHDHILEPPWCEIHWNKYKHTWYWFINSWNSPR